MDAKVVRHISLNDGRRPKFSPCVMLFVKKIHHVICHNVISSLWAFDNQKTHTARNVRATFWTHRNRRKRSLGAALCPFATIYGTDQSTHRWDTNRPAYKKSIWNKNDSIAQRPTTNKNREKKRPPYKPKNKTKKQQRNGKMWQHKYKQGKRKQFISFSIWSRPTVNTMWIIVKCGHYSWSPHTCKETIRKCVQGGP